MYTSFILDNLGSVEICRAIYGLLGDAEKFNLNAAFIAQLAERAGPVGPGGFVLPHTTNQEEPPCRVGPLGSTLF